jgi:hypothetical protein
MPAIRSAALLLLYAESPGNGCTADPDEMLTIRSDAPGWVRSTTNPIKRTAATTFTA